MTVSQHQLALHPKYEYKKCSKFYEESNGANYFKIGWSQLDLFKFVCKFKIEMTVSQHQLALHPSDQLGNQKRTANETNQINYETKSELIRSIMKPKANPSDQL